MPLAATVDEMELLGCNLYLYYTRFKNRVTNNKMGKLMAKPEKRKDKERRRALQSIKLNAKVTSNKVKKKIARPTGIYLMYSSKINTTECIGIQR